MAEAACDFWECEFCHRRFGTKTGLGVHRQRAHKEQYEQRVQGERMERKIRWTNEEMFLLADKEVELEMEGVRFMNAGLLPFFPGRSLEAIKGKRRQQEYKTMIETLRARRRDRDRRPVVANRPAQLDEPERGVAARLRPRRPPREALEHELHREQPEEEDGIHERDQVEAQARGRHKGDRQTSVGGSFERYAGMGPRGAV
ncbi:UNVERIFIED_CONTAM: hypothetical protein RMT77_002534 [Armadillidium vulgare]